MAKNESTTEVILNGRQASELFLLHQGYKLWLKKKEFFSVEKTKEEWEKFFKENKVV